MKAKKTTLPNGLRIVTIPTPGNPAVTTMVMVETGSNYEKKEENGLAHFLEHMCFKGTVKRPTALSISREFDSIGAESNAFTGNEYTGFYAKAEKKHFSHVLDVLADVYLNSTFSDAEIEKERGVIFQEISMYEDNPQRKVVEMFNQLLYGDTPAGRLLTGTVESLSKLKRKDFLAYHKKHYVADGTTIIISGDIDEALVRKEIKEKFKGISSSKKGSKERVKEKQSEPALKVYTKKTDQTHMILGVRAFDAHDPRTDVLSVMANVLSGGMSARLFQKLREEMGACYYVYAGTDEFTDHGYFAISVGVDKNRITEVIKVLLAECQKLIDEPVSEEELHRVKEFMSGHIYLGLETTDALANFYATQEAIKHSSETPQEMIKKLRAVTAKDIQKVAKEIFKNNNLNLAIVGDIEISAELKQALSF
jgi:predicted Zn-dependent peptidase